VLRVSDDGRYEFRRGVASLQDYLDVKTTYETVRRVQLAMREVK
jgi:hypothetical protein